MLNYKIHVLDGFTTDEKSKINKALELAVKAVNSDEFKDRVLNYSHTVSWSTGSLWWKKTFSRKVDSFYFAPGEKVFTNEQVYDRVMKGNETLQRSEDGEMDIFLIKDSKKSNSVTAYTYPNVQTIYLYQWWITVSSVFSLSNTIFHEWTHKLGFEHDFKRTPLRPYSVPYGLGEIVQAIIKKNPEWV